MVPKPYRYRLSTNMQNIEMTWQMWDQPAAQAAFRIDKESKLKLSVEARNYSGVIVVHCCGRIVYRDEAAALSRVVGEVLQERGKLVLELSGVTAMDSAGIGELVLLQTLATGKNAEFKCAGPNSALRALLDLTNLDSVIEVHSSLEEALVSFREEHACADC